MKKVIEKMGAAAAEEQRRALAPAGSASPPNALGAASSSAKEGKRRWLGGAIRKVTGGSASGAASPPAPAGEEEDNGLQVDFYLVIVGLSSIIHLAPPLVPLLTSSVSIASFSSLFTAQSLPSSAFRPCPLTLVFFLYFILFWQ